MLLLAVLANCGKKADTGGGGNTGGGMTAGSLLPPILQLQIPLVL